MTNSIVTIDDGKVILTSVDLAKAFSKNHKDVLKVIRREEEFFKKNASEQPGRNFAPSPSDQPFIRSTYSDANGQKRKMYKLTQKGFLTIAMGFSGEKAAALRWHILDEFERLSNELERLRAEGFKQHEPDSYFERQRIKYLEYKPSYHNSMNAIKQLIAYAVQYFGADKDELDKYCYRKCNGSINKALDIPKGERPNSDPETAVHLKLLHRKVNDVIIHGINLKDNPYLIIDRVISAINDYHKNVIEYRPPKLILTIE